MEHKIDQFTYVVAPVSQKIGERLISLEKRDKTRQRLPKSVVKGLNKVRPAKPLPQDAFRQFRLPAEEQMDQSMEYGKTYRIAQFNLKKMQNVLGEHRFVQLATSADIFMMQEFVTEPPFLKTLYDEGHTGRMSIHFYPREDIATGVATFGKIRPSRQIYVISQDREIGWRSYKSAVCTFYPFPTQFSSVYDHAIFVNVHGFNFGSKRGLGRQFDKIKQILLPLKRRNRIVVGGDMNTWNLGRLDLFFRFVDDLGFKIIPLGDNISSRFGIPLDWVCVSKGVEVSNVRVVNNQLYSDHASIEYDLAFDRDNY